MTIHPTVEHTIRFVTAAHAGQVDKAGQPYIDHLLRVMHRLPASADDDTRMVALLHDVIEDHCSDVRELQRHGYRMSIVRAVVHLTRRPGCNYERYIQGIAGSRNRMAVAVKIADLQDHLDPRRRSAIPESLVKRYEAALSLLTSNATA